MFQVSAATAVVPSEDRVVAVPEIDVPPEPVGAPRVAQIMRLV